MPIVVRQARRDDLPGIRAIYNHAIRELAATFDTEEKSLADRAAWFDAHDDRHPIFVAIDDDMVVGWASLSPFSERSAYARTVENSVYIRIDRWGEGIGGMLMEALMRAAREAEHHVVVAKITGDNEASVRLHRHFGFVEAGALHQVGWKFGRWHDIHIMEAILEEEKR